MILSLKVGCVALYALAIAGLVGFLPDMLATVCEHIAAIFLALHTIEVVFLFKNVRLYRGSLIVSVLLTMLFGLLNWWPLVEQARPQAHAIAGRTARLEGSNLRHSRSN
jgi:hypothetical protein